MKKCFEKKNEITYVRISFCASIKFSNVGNVKTLSEVFPYLRTETISKHQSYLNKKIVNKQVMIEKSINKQH